MLCSSEPTNLPDSVFTNQPISTEECTCSVPFVYIWFEVIESGVRKSMGLFVIEPYHSGGTPWSIWLRHCATNRKVAVPIPDRVTGIFQ
jgi:hypothetical protein